MHGAPDDPVNCTQSHGHFFSFRTTDLQPQNVSDADSPDSTSAVMGGGNVRSEPMNMTADEAGTWILEHTPGTFQVSKSVANLLCYSSQGGIISKTHTDSA
jgi:phospholipid:diacylglycerol acyltransferase